jgi:hypothetical protein
MDLALFVEVVEAERAGGPTWTLGGNAGNRRRFCQRMQHFAIAASASGISGSLTVYSTASTIAELAHHSFHRSKTKEP